jgi:hypothetical protein
MSESPEEFLARVRIVEVPVAERETTSPQRKKAASPVDPLVDQAAEDREAIA